MKIIFVLIIILLAIMLIIFIPLPLKTIIYCSKENYYIKFFNFRIIYKKQINVDDTTVKPSDEPIKHKKKKKKKKNELFQDFPILKVLKLINKRKRKSKLYVQGNITYSLNDAANTAIFYGVLSSLLPITQKTVSILFNPKKFNINITPQYTDVFSYEIMIKSILFISIGQIISMCYLILKIIIIEKVEKYE